MQLEGKKVMVIGGSSGIGLAIARAAANAGAVLGNSQTVLLPSALLSGHPL